MVFNNSLVKLFKIEYWIFIQGLSGTIKCFRQPCFLCSEKVSLG
jgi:hypothetical protein